MFKNLKLFFCACILSCTLTTFAQTPGKGNFFAGQDIHLSAGEMKVFPSPKNRPDEQVVVFKRDFSLEIGGTLLNSDQAVVWITTKRQQYRGSESVDYSVRAYLEDNVKVSQNWSGKIKHDDSIIEKGESLIVHFFVSGEVYATASERIQGSVEELEKTEIYKKASISTQPVRSKLRVSPEAIVPRYKDNITIIDEKFGKPVKNPLKVSDYFEIKDVEPEEGPAVALNFDETESSAGEKKQSEGEYRYPINISGVWQREPEFRVTEIDGQKVATLMGRFYLWQRKKDGDEIIEFLADNGVIFYSSSEDDSENELSADAVYFSGNIVMTEGERTIRADELFYDFVNKRALAVNAEMRKFDEKRGIPVYIRAAKLQQVAENIYKADDIVLTTSEFYAPQISVEASQLVMTDRNTVDERAEGIKKDSEFDAVLSGIKMKMGKRTFFAWPGMRTNFERPDVPIQQLKVGHDSNFGTTVESRWYLSRLLGLKEPEGYDSSLMVDYFSDRGPGAGIVVDYARDDYFGGLSGYIIKDRGADRLGRTRKNLEPGNEIRGRFTARHRHYLPYNWQATLEASYISDENFLESYFRREFNISKAQETLIYLKRLQDYWAYSFLTKVRINDFESELEEIPTGELHVKGMSFWDNLLTYYGDTTISRLRNRVPDGDSREDSGDFFTYVTTRHEVDAPLKMGTINIVPFAAGTYSIDDQDGFETNLNNNLSNNPQEKVLLGEVGVRTATMFWKDDMNFKSKFWDVDGLRHTVKPHFEAVTYQGDSRVIEMRDFMNFGLSQRWRTRRGSKEDRRTVDWMRLDIDATYLTDTADSSLSPPLPGSYGPAKFIWNDPSIPIFTRRNTSYFGMLRDTVNIDYNWRVSDTLVFLSDMNYDTQAGVVQQLDIGVARYVYPDISYYLGNRYFRPVTVNVPSAGVFEQGSNSVIGSITYALNNRFTFIASEEYNFDYGKNVRTEFALLRRYHRLYAGLTLSIDESREENSIMFSIWPQGVKDLTFGDRRYASFRDGILEN